MKYPSTLLLLASLLVLATASEDENSHRDLQYGGNTPLMAQASNFFRGYLPELVQNKFPVIEQGGYQINLATSGVTDAAPFDSAKNKWQSVITGDIPEASTGACSDDCGCIPDPVDDLHICGSYLTIDGPGGILGRAGPTRLRTGSFLPATGIMEFDSADVGNVEIKAIIEHEMGHVIGIGTIWTQLGLTNSGSPTCTYKSDSQASARYRTLSGCSGAIPIENDGGAGTACGHWDETCFTSEIMTGFLGTAQPIFSAITIAGVADLGYTVDFSQAQAYGKDKLGSSCKCRRRNLRGNETDVVQEVTEFVAVRPIGGPTNRKLSSAGLEAAMAYGYESLDRHNDDKIGWAPFGYNRYKAVSDDLIYVGDKIVNVLYIEDGQIYDVMVSRL